MSRFDLEPARGFDLLNPIPHLSDSVIEAHRDTLAKLAGYQSAAAMDRDAVDLYGDVSLSDARREMLATDWLREETHNPRLMAALAALWTLAGVPAEVIESRGYSQGDWATLLVVAHPEAIEGFGFASVAEYLKQCPDDLRTAATLWGAWCWGGVIGYEVAALDSDEWEAEGRPTDARTLNRMDGEYVDSCWNFYPEHDQDYFPLERNHAYALSQAIAEAEAHGAKRADARAAELAERIQESRPDMVPAW